MIVLSALSLVPLPVKYFPMIICRNAGRFYRSGHHPRFDKIQGVIQYFRFLLSILVLGCICQNQYAQVAINTDQSTSRDTGINRDGQRCGSVIYGGKTYNPMTIGTQCRRTEKLNIGTAILSTEGQTNNGAIEKYCYDNNFANCNTYGGLLYQWAELVRYLNGATNTTSWNPVPSGPIKGIYPGGWHVSADEEWTDLKNYLGGPDVAGGNEKETGTRTHRYTFWNTSKLQDIHADV